MYLHTTNQIEGNLLLDTDWGEKKKIGLKVEFS